MYQVEIRDSQGKLLAENNIWADNKKEAVKILCEQNNIVLDADAETGTKLN